MAVRVDGCTRYTQGRAALVASFPNGEIACKHCWLCADDARMRQRRVCLGTMEILYDINRLGARCPLEFEEEQDGTEQPDLSTAAS